VPPIDAHIFLFGQSARALHYPTWAVARGWREVGPQ